MKKLLWSILLIVSYAINAMDMGFAKSKSLRLEPEFSYVTCKSVFKPLQISGLHDLITSDKCISSYIDYYQQGDNHYLSTLKGLARYELSKATNNQEIAQWNKRVEILDTMLTELNATNLTSYLEPGYAPQQSGGGISSRAQQVHEKTHQHLPSQKKSSHPSHHKCLNAIKLSKSGKNFYIKINGYKRFVCEGEHVEAFNKEWVVKGNELVYLGNDRESIVDGNGKCHVRDFQGTLQCLSDGNYVLFHDMQALLYKNGKLLTLLNGDSLVIDGKKYSNIMGGLSIHDQAPKAIETNLDSAVEQKVKIYGLDKGQDFTSVANHILNNYDLMLTGLTEQCPENIELIRQDIESDLYKVKNAQTLQDFSYHLSAIDLRLAIAEHIQEYKNQHRELDADFSNTLLEKINRSSELLGRAIEHFAKRIKYSVTHPQEEIYYQVMAPIHMAKLSLSIGKIAAQFGVEFISSQDKWQFVCDTWSQLADVCNHITAEQVFDQLGELAAVVITQRGMSKLCSHLTKFEMATEAIQKGHKLYGHIEKGVDTVLKRNPMPIPAQSKIPSAEIIADMHKRGIRIPDVTQRSIDTIRALKEHPLYYVNRRTYREIREFKHLFEGKYKGFGPFANQYIKFPWKHILAPEFDRVKKDYLARLRGWHHDYNGLVEKSGLIEFVNKKMVKDGFYRGIIKWNGRELDKTFFPSHLKVEDVMQMIIEAYQDFLDQGAKFVFKDSFYRISGYTKNDIKIIMFIGSNGKIKTCYPILK